MPAQMCARESGNGRNFDNSSLFRPIFPRPEPTRLDCITIQIDDHLQENIQAALCDRESGVLVKTALWDDLHVSRGKAEQLEARLRRQALEEEVSHAPTDNQVENSSYNGGGRHSMTYVSGCDQCPEGQAKRN